MMVAQKFPELRSRPVSNGTSKMPLSTMSVMTVTPDQAATWLANGGKNRKLSQRRITRYANAMRRGEWRLTYEAIKLDRDAKIRDGQHRLHAIVESKVAVEMLVVYGVQEDAFDVMDSGANRTVADVVSIHDIERSDAISGVVRFLVLWEMDHRHGVYGANTPAVTAPQTLEYIEDHPDVTEWLDTAAAITRANMRGGRALWGGLLTLFGRIDREATTEFAEGIISGANLAPGSPMLTLRKQLINMPGKGRAITNRTACWIIKAFNAYHRGLHVYQLKWGTDEAFPEPE